MTANGKTKRVKGRIVVEGIRTLYAEDGKTVKEQRAVLKADKGIFSKRFLVPMSLFTLDEVTKAMVENHDFFPPDTELVMQDVKPVHGSLLTYEGKLLSVIRPLPEKTLQQLVDSQTIANKP